MLARAVLVIVLLSLASSARAQEALDTTDAERPLSDAIVVAEGDPCVDAAGLVAHVTTWLGRDRIAASLGVIVETGGADASFAVTRGGERTATRRFDDLPDACPDRRAVIALAIALALDAAVLESIGIPAPEPPIAPEDEPEPVPIHEPEIVPLPVPPPRGERTAFGFEAEAIFFVEVLPDPAFAGAVSLAAMIDGGFRVRGGFVATQRVGASVGRGSADLALLAGRLDGCFSRSVADGLLLGGCAGAIAGAVLAEGRDFAITRSAEIPWVGGAARAELRWMPVEVLALGLGIEGLFTIVRPRLDVGDGAGGVIEARSLPPAGLGVLASAAMVIE